MEVTYDPSTGGSFESHNGNPINDAEPQPLAQEVPTQEPPTYQEESAPVIEEEEEQEEDGGLSPMQEGAAQIWEGMKLDPRGAIEWADSEDCPLSEDSYNRLGDLIKDEDPAAVKLGMGLVSIAKRNGDWFDFENEQVTESFSEEQQQSLYDLLGGEYTSKIVNHNFKLMSGELTKADILREVAADEVLRNKYFHAAKAGLLIFHI
jgi:hypothetical protein